MIKSGTLQENFEIALEKVDILTEHNQKLMDKVADLEYRLTQSKHSVNKDHPIKPTNNSERLYEISKGAEEAIERYKQFLKKEFPNAKSKQSKRQSV
jgi:hypothetical protein